MKEPGIAKNVRKEGPTHTDSAGNKLLNNRTVPPNLLSPPDETPSDDNDVTIQADAIPDELKKPNQWVMWHKETRNSKPTKVPYTVDNVPAKADDPTTWNSCNACLEALNSGGKYHFSGIGFEFSKASGITGIDIDHCLNPDTGEIEKWAAEKVQQFDNYAEVSPSGDGLHIFVKGVKPGERSKRGNVEMYDSGRFFTVTGAHVKGTPFSIEPRQNELDAFYAEFFCDEGPKETVAPQAPTGSADAKLLAKATNAKNGKKFKRLYYEGDASDYPSASEADLALCSELAFWTDGDREQMDRLFRGSARYRAKWDERHGAQTYGQMTITKAIEGRGDGYRQGTDQEGGCEQYFDGSRFVAKRVAYDILSRHYFFTFTDTEEIYAYDALEGIYRPGGEYIIRDETQKLLGDHTTNHYVSEVEGYIRRSRYMKRDQLAQSPDLIPVKNGVLNRKTRTLEPYTPEKPFVSKIPVSYDPEAAGAAFEEYLNETFRPEDILVAEEILGDVLYRSNWHKKAVMLLGPGDNGKSIFFYVEGSLLGSENIATRSLQDIDRDRFAKADLFGKYANIHADIPSTALKTTGTFKMLTGGDRVTAERKYQQPFTFVNYAKLHFSANELPFTKDQTPAFFNRWLLIELPYRFVDNPQSEGEKKRDPHLLKKLTTDEALSGILNVALDGLDRLLENGRFTTSKASEDVKERWIARTDSLQSFVEKHVLVKKGCFVSKDQFYGAYLGYCDEQDLNADEIGIVGRRLPTLITTTSFRPELNGARPMAWKDLRVDCLDERRYSSHREDGDNLNQIPLSPHVKHVKANLAIPCICEDEILDTDINSNSEEESENLPDARDVRAASAPIDEAPPDYLCALILERLRLRVSYGKKSPTVDELMVQTVKDVQMDHPDIDPAEIAAAFRVVQLSYEGQQLIKQVVPQADASVGGVHAGAE